MALDVLRRMQPGSLAVCTLLRKPAAASVPIPELRYVGFEIADEFVVGYGLDFNGRYRNLPAIRVLDPGGGPRGRRLTPPKLHVSVKVW